MEAINFYIVHMIVLILAEFIWSFFVTFVGLKVLRQNSLLFTKQFFLFIGIASLTSVFINRFFEFAISEVSIIEGIWTGLGRIEKVGLLLVPTFILMYAYFYLASITLRLRAKQLLFIVLILGLANSPWRILL